MIISESHRFIFVAVPKTASSSIEHVLRNYGAFYGRQAKHLTAEQIIRNAMVKDWNSYASFAVIRYPLDWLHSWYKFWRAAATDPKTQVAPHNRLPDITFAEFVSRTLHGHERTWTHVGTQARRVCDTQSGEVLIGNLLCYDHLSRQFPQVLASLGLPAASLPERNISKLQQPLPELPADLLTEVRRHWHNDFVLYARAHLRFASEIASTGEVLPPPRFPVDAGSEIDKGSLRAANERRGFRIGELLRKGGQAGKSRPAGISSGGAGESSREARVLRDERTKAESVTQDSPNSVQSQLQLAASLIRSGKLDNAAATLASVIARKPGSARAYRLLSAVRMREGNLEEAIALTQKAIALKPTNGEFLAHLAKLQKRREARIPTAVGVGR